MAAYLPKKVFWIVAAIAAVLQAMWFLYVNRSLGLKNGIVGFLLLAPAWIAVAGALAFVVAALWGIGAMLRQRLGETERIVVKESLFSTSTARAISAVTLGGFASSTLVLILSNKGIEVDARIWLGSLAILSILSYTILYLLGRLTDNEE